MIDPREIILVPRAILAPDDWVEVRSISQRGARSRTVRVSALDQPEILAWIEARVNTGDGVYFGPNPRHGHVGGGRSGTHLDTDTRLARSFFVDFDDAVPDHAVERIERAKLPPATLIVASGRATGTHAYWVFRDTLADLAAWRGVQRALTGLVGSDPTVTNPSRVMRLPGTLNHKHDARCRVVSHDGPVLDSWKALGIEPAPTHSLGEYHTAGGAPNWSNLTQRTNGYLVIPSAPGERNSRLFKAACDMAANGFSREQVEAKLAPLATQRDGLPDSETRTTIAKAFSKPRTTMKQPFDAVEMSKRINSKKPNEGAVCRDPVHGGEQ